MHEVWRALVLRQIRLEHLSSMRKEAAITRERSVPGKHGISALILALKEAKIKAEAIPVQMHQGNTETQHMKYNNETPTVVVHVGQINETTTLNLSTEEECSQATSEDHDLGYIKRVLSSLEETPIDPK